MGFFQKIGNAISRFMYGRNGLDQLSMGMVAVELVVYVISLFIGGTVGTVLYFLCLAVWGIIIFRALSKDLYKRRAENTKFLNWWMPIQRKLMDAKQRAKDKDHKYFRCKCGAYCRVPKGKGKIIITCPKCKSKIEAKS